jgi:uncharacterized protein (TIGR03083 family)
MGHSSYSSDDVWRWVREERTRLADVVDVLTPEEWEASSWCDGWRVCDVVGHLVHVAEANSFTMTRDVVRKGVLVNAATARIARGVGAQPASELAQRLRAAAGGRFRAPGAPPGYALGEVLVHRADITRPLDLDGDPEPRRVVPC